MVTFTVQVTQEDIDNGIPDNTRKCPVALAINRVASATLGQVRVKSTYAFWPDINSSFTLSGTARE